MDEQYFFALLREAHKQGYLNAMADSASDSEWNDSDSDFDDWIAEVIAQRQVGDLAIELPGKLG
ncbi:hypothetical protein LJ739_06935 [Aestuariibacter halophilus]|uniref:Uncharacterized protein n=1 Tax=Fluctibacter halophilus TaxID=226011 RepID=A0ABS8G5W1_9ALTE|nr:hypothetical protein [Aestuariibacter halophilus]MCC2615972.1 hypothetical protein [Aestuariibacter halophilus]